MSQESLTLRCESCGHTWNARNTPGTSRQCSKCRSRRIEEAKDALDNISDASVERVPVDRGDPATPAELKDDPDIREKMKELELAKLDKQLRELKRGPNDDAVIERLVINNIELLCEMSASGTIDEKTYESLASSCPWCGANGGDGLVYEEYRDGGQLKNGFRCASCGHWVPY